MTTVAQQPGTTGDDDRPSVHQAVVHVMKDVKVVRKTGQNTAPGQGYNFRGIDEVMNALGPAFRKHGLFIVPQVEEATYRDVKTVTGKPAREVTVRVRYVVFGPRGDSLSGVVSGEAMDSGDKGTAKATSVALRTFMLQLFCLPTLDEDPDSQTYERGRGDVSVGDRGEQRDADRPARERLMEHVKTSGERLRVAREESEYVAAERVAKYAKDILGVDVVGSRGPDGEIETLDLDRLSNEQLQYLYGVTKKALATHAAATQAV